MNDPNPGPASGNPWRLDGTTRFFIGLAVVAGGAVGVLHGGGAVAEALGRAGALLVWILPILVGAMFISAYVQALVPRAVIQRWLGRESGLRGLVVATVAGAITPGGPFAAFPLVLALHRTGASLATCVAYLTAWSVLGINRALVWEVPFLGPEFVGLRLLASLPLPVLAGVLTELLVRRLERRS